MKKLDFTGANPMQNKAIQYIMPDYTTNRNIYFKIDCFFVIFTFIVELIMYFNLKYHGYDIENLRRYLLSYIIIPSSLNGLILLITAIIRVRLPKDNGNMIQNIAPILAMTLISLVISIAYSAYYFSTLLLFCVPICMSAMFNMKKLCKTITSLGVISVVIAGIKYFINSDEVSLSLQILPELVTIILIIIITGIIVNTIMDMTEKQKGKLIQFTKDLGESGKKAAAANMAKSAFLANMSHEIRTPINAVLGMNEMILRESQDEQILEYASNIQSSGETLLYIINDVLDISKIESGKLEIIENTYDTSSLINNCYNMVANRAENKGLDFIITCNPFLPSQLRGDETRLRQIITNLLTNAVKYTVHGSVTMHVDKRQEDDEFTLVVTVSDTGIGIKKENIPELFQNFSRFDLEKNRNIEGTGLGLAITMQLVNLMNGKLSVESEYGKGSSFTFCVPQQVMSTTPMGDFQRRYIDKNENKKYRQSFEAPDARILVVDDVEVNLKVFSNLLRKTKIMVDTASSGKECLSLVTKTSYDIIFMDHMMPEMDGVATYENMKSLPDSLNKETPVIMLTANAISGARELYMANGFANYLSKPIRSEKLEGMIVKYLPENKVLDKSSEKNEENTIESPNEKLEEALPEESKSDFDEYEDGDMISVNQNSETDNLTILQNLFQRYPHADLSLGLSYCGQNPDIYLTVVQTYGENPKTDDLTSFYENKDLENYRILVHGIKSSSLNIGFSHLSEKAKALEMAAKQNDWDFINENHEDFIEEYKTAIDAINSSC